MEYLHYSLEIKNISIRKYKYLLYNSLQASGIGFQIFKRI